MRRLPCAGRPGRGRMASVSCAVGKKENNAGLSACRQRSPQWEQSRAHHPTRLGASPGNPPAPGARLGPTRQLSISNFRRANFPRHTGPLGKRPMVVAHSTSAHPGGGGSNRIVRARDRARRTAHLRAQLSSHPSLGRSWVARHVPTRTRPVVSAVPMRRRPRTKCSKDGVTSATPPLAQRVRPTPSCRGALRRPHILALWSAWHGCHVERHSSCTS